MKMYSWEIWDDFRLKFNSDFNLNLTDDVTLLGSSDLARYILTKYGSWRYICGFESVDDAYTDFLATWKQFVDLRKNDLLRLYEALNMEYNPIENYDRHEDITSSDSGSDTTKKTSESLIQTDINGTNDSSTTYSGVEKDEHTFSHNSTDTNIKSGSELINEEKNVNGDITVSYEGMETNKNTPNLTKNENVSAFNSDGFSNLNQTIESGSDIAEKTFNGRKDVTDTSNLENLSRETSFDNLTETINSNGNNSEDIIKSFENRTDTTNASNSSQKLEDMESNDDVTTTYGKVNTLSNHTHGNIGVTTTQQMLDEEIRLRFYNLASDIVDKFMYEYTVMY